MANKITCLALVFYFTLMVNAIAQDEDNVLRYNGIYQTGNSGKEFKLKKDSTQTYKIDTTGFVSIIRFKKIKTSFDNSGYPILNIEINDIGIDKFSNLTGNNIGKPLAIVINNTLYTAPIVNVKISNGLFEVSGFYSVEELEKLKRLIEVMKLHTAKSKLD